jgi:hypothetical protein
MAEPNRQQSEQPPRIEPSPDRRMPDTADPAASDEPETERGGSAPQSTSRLNEVEERQ